MIGLPKPRMTAIVIHGVTSSRIAITYPPSSAGRRHHAGRGSDAPRRGPPASMLRPSRPKKTAIRSAARLVGRSKVRHPL